MEEYLPDALLKAADALHWLGQYRISNTLILTSRLLRVHGLGPLEALEAFVEKEENRCR